MTPGAFVRIPVEALAGVAVVLALPARAARIVVGLAAGVAGLLAIGRIVDAGFAVVLARPFDPVFDASFLGDAVDFLRTQVGSLGATAAVMIVVVALGAIVALSALAAVRMVGIVDRRRAPATRTVAALGAIWLVGALLGWPAAAWTTVADAASRAVQVDAGLRDK